MTHTGLTTPVPNTVSATGLIRDSLTSRADRAVQALETRTSHSWKMALDRGDVMSDSASTAGAPGLNLFLRQAEGATVIDLDGNAFVDLCMGYGAQLLGHAHPDVTAAIAEQITRGWQLGLPNEAQLNLARRIQAAAPANERVVFCASGSDATLFAMRAARAVTGKDGIGVFTGSFHGAHDYGLIGGDSESTDAVQRKVHIGAGVPRAVDEIMTVLPYGHPAAFDLIRRRRNELAAVMVEAVRGNDPHLDAGSWLQELGAVCRASGVLLILDEVTTGFRLAYGGAQEYFGLRPEMVAYGKAVGGGLPLGVVAGRSDIMRVFSAEAGPRGIFSASTFAGNPLSIAAGLAALKFADTHRDTLYPALEASAVQLAATFSAAAADLGVPARLQHAGSMLRVVLGTVQPRNSAAAAALRQAEDAFATHLLNGGVLMQTGLRGFLAAAHDPAQIDLAAKAFTAALAELKTDGLFAPITAP